jgi:hypothetical protein
MFAPQKSHESQMSNQTKKQFPIESLVFSHLSNIYPINPVMEINEKNSIVLRQTGLYFFFLILK